MMAGAAGKGLCGAEAWKMFTSGIGGKPTVIRKTAHRAAESVAGRQKAVTPTRAVQLEWTIKAVHPQRAAPTDAPKEKAVVLTCMTYLDYLEEKIFRTPPIPPGSSWYEVDLQERETQKVQQLVSVPSSSSAESASNSPREVADYRPPACWQHKRGRCKYGSQCRVELGWVK